MALRFRNERRAFADLLHGDERGNQLPRDRSIARVQLVTGGVESVVVDKFIGRTIWQLGLLFHVFRQTDWFA